MSKPFHFKQFSVAQEHCAMKVGTDGVLLGAWAKTPEKVQTILDIGTGSGVIALMLAQRFPEAQITAIDLDKGAYRQATENFENSKFSKRLHAEHCALQDFKTPQKFDAIVSNPPFFTEGVLPENSQRKLARHTVAFSFEMFFEKIAHLLTEKGILSVILPKEICEKSVQLAESFGLYCHERCVVYPNPVKEAKRVLLTFGKQKVSVSNTELTIETLERHCYTEEYKTLLRDFYLAF